jgi:hypothetical protein
MVDSPDDLYDPYSQLGYGAGDGSGGGGSDGGIGLYGTTTGDGSGGDGGGSSAFGIPGSSPDFSGTSWNPQGSDYGATLAMLNPAMAGATYMPNSAFNTANPYQDNRTFFDRAKSFLGSSQLQGALKDVGAAGDQLQKQQDKQTAADTAYMNQQRQQMRDTKASVTPGKGAAQLTQLLAAMQQRRAAMQTSNLGQLQGRVTTPGLLTVG